MLTWIILGVAGAVVTLLSHELSHAVINLVVGRKITSFKLWPHFYNDKFYFARVSSTGPGDNLDKVHISPLIKALPLLLIWLAVARYLYIPFIVFAVWELVDVIWWLKGFFFGPEHTDGMKFRNTV